MSNKGYSLRGTNKRTADISTAIRFEAMVDRRIVEFLRTKIPADVMAEAERMAADAVLNSGLFDVR